MPYFNISDKNVLLKITDEENSKDNFIEIKININYLKSKIEEFKNITINEIPCEIEMTERELEVLKYISEGKNNKEIAQLLNISMHTVKGHIHNIFSKLSSNDRTDAVIKAIKAKILVIE